MISSNALVALVLIGIALAIMSFVRVQVRAVRVRVPRESDPGKFEALRALAEESPSAANMLELAEALEAGGMAADAAALYRKVLATDERDRQALHGLARCAVDQGDPQEGVKLLGKLMELDRGFRDYRAALDYAEALWQADAHDDAVDFAEAMAAHTGRINHWVAAAHYAGLAGHRDRARESLERGLAGWAASPPAEQQQRQRWERRARTMLRQLDHPSDG